MKTASAGLACLALATSAGQAIAQPLELPPDLPWPASFVVRINDRTVAAHAETTARQPASLAKLAGAIVVLEAAERAPEGLASAVRVSAWAAGALPVRLGLRAADTVRLRDLLAASVIGSANDACRALAEHVAGTEQAFVAAMNRLAVRLGMRDTYFAEPCGFDRPEQRTTALDLLRLADAALALPELARLAGTTAHGFETLDGKRSFVIRNGNALLGMHPNVIGLKTGYTRGAGPSAIVVAREGLHTITVVVLQAEQRWPVTTVLLDWALERAQR